MSSIESKISSSATSITSSTVRKSEMSRISSNIISNSNTNDFSPSVDLLSVDDDDYVDLECMSVNHTNNGGSENGIHDASDKGNIFTKLIEREKLFYEDLLEEDGDLESQGDDLDVELMGVCNASDNTLVSGMEGENSPGDNSISPQPQPDLLIHLSAEDDFGPENDDIDMHAPEITYGAMQESFSEFYSQHQEHNNIHTYNGNGTIELHEDEVNATVKEEKRKLKSKKIVQKSEANVESISKSSKGKVSEEILHSSFDSSSSQQEIMSSRSSGGSVSVSSTTTKMMKKMSSIESSENVSVQKGIQEERIEDIVKNGAENHNDVAVNDKQNNAAKKKKSLKKKNEHISVKQNDEIDNVDVKQIYERNRITNNKGYGISRDYDDVVSSAYSSLPNTYLSSVTTSNNVSISKLKSMYNNAANEHSSIKRKIAASNSTSSAPYNDSRVFAKVSVAHLRRSFGDLTNITNNNNEDEPQKLHYGSSKSSFNKFDKLARNDSVASMASQDTEKSSGMSRSSSVANHFQNGGDNDGIQQQKAIVEKKYCRSCEKQVFQMEMIKAEKSQWHRPCFKCTQCSKTLSVDTYQSHEGQLYCKPHFKELFQPKAVFEDPDKDSGTNGRSKLPEVIIRENQPVELPPDVVRACEKSSTGLEDIQIDVRSRFELFERQATKEAQLKSPSPDETHNRVNVKKSASVIAKLAKYQTNIGMDIGVPDDALNGNNENMENEESSDENEEGANNGIPGKKIKSPLAVMNEIMQFKQIEDVRSKWEVGMNSNKEVLNEARKEEMAKFRTRLCLGKSNQLKEMYEKAVNESESEGTVPGTVNEELEQLRLEKAKRLREMFERGEVVNEDEEFEESENVANGATKSNERIVDRDLAVFESAVAKQSRSLFKEMDKSLVRSGGSTVFQFGVGGIKTPTTPDIRKTIEVIRGDGSKRNESPEDASREVYRDPNVVRSEDKVGYDTEEIMQTKTASKMLNVFRQLEEKNSDTNSAYFEGNPRPLKQFTPPREPQRFIDNQDSEEEQEEEDEEEYDEEEEEERALDDPVANAQKLAHDEFLKEVGSLARARSLRAKFERWEQQENVKNSQGVNEDSDDVSMDGADRNRSVQLGEATDDSQSENSIESAKNLRAKFELQLQQLQSGVKFAANDSSVSTLTGDIQHTNRRAVKVNRFVNHNPERQQRPERDEFSFEINHNNKEDTESNHSSIIMSSSTENCEMCQKRVYAMEKVEAGGKLYHKACFRCSQCKCILRMDTFTSNKGTLFCTPHFKQLFKIKGNYDEGFGYETQKQIWAKKQAAKMKESAEGGN